MKTFAQRYPGFEVKGLKWFQGMEGSGFNASIYKDGRKLAFVIDEGNGGCYHYDYLTKDAESSIKALVELKRSEIPADQQTEGMKDHDLFDCDWMISDMMTAWDFEKRLRRLCTKAVVFVTPDMKDGEARSLKGPYTPEAVDRIKKKFPNAEILNEVLR